jgi:hypothetical protein
MKRIYLALVTALILGIAPIAQLQATPTRIVIKNNYGAPIKYQLNHIMRMGQTTIKETGKEILVYNNESVTVCSIKDLIAGKGVSILELLIRTTGTGSGYGLSPYTALYGQLQSIQQEYNKHPYADAAVITIHPSSFYQEWNIDVTYQ